MRLSTLMLLAACGTDGPDTTDQNAPAYATMVGGSWQIRAADQYPGAPECHQAEGCYQCLTLEEGGDALLHQAETDDVDGTLEVVDLGTWERIGEGLRADDYPWTESLLVGDWVWDVAMVDPLPRSDFNRGTRSIRLYAGDLCDERGCWDASVRTEGFCRWLEE